MAFRMVLIMTTTIPELIDEIGLGVIAVSMNTTPQRVSNWRSRGVPTDEVLAFCAAVKWRMTPHQVCPKIYPNSDDGLPIEIKRAMIDVDPSRVMASLKGQQPAVPKTPLRRVTDIQDPAFRNPYGSSSHDAGSPGGTGPRAAGQE
jgi:hypothetical protein